MNTLQGIVNLAWKILTCAVLVEAIRLLHSYKEILDKVAKGGF